MSDAIPESMPAVTLPGDSTTHTHQVAVPRPGHGEVLVRTAASTICGSDIRAIYREHLGTGPEGYQGVTAGHEPAGQIVAVGPGCRRFGTGDRVILYHISGCGLCNDCRRGYMISCTDETHRRAYGWQRDGGMAPYLLAEEKDLVALPDELTYVDGAQVACGFGTVYEGLCRIGIAGTEAFLVTGLGPVGLAAAMLARAMGAQRIIGVDVVEERRALATDLDLCDHVLDSTDDVVDRIRHLTGGHGVERAADCSANPAARRVAVRSTRKWGSIVLLGEGGQMSFEPSPDLLHEQKSIHGSWVTSIWRMEELVEQLVRWGLHPERLVTHRFPLDRVDEAYALMADGRCGKVAVTF